MPLNGHSTEEGIQLLGTVVILRHGARTPKKQFHTPDSEWQFEGSLGQLTLAGWQQAILLGGLLQSHYSSSVSALETIREAYDGLSTVLSIQTTDSSRCVQTAQAILTGFLFSLDRAWVSLDTLDPSRHAADTFICTEAVAVTPTTSISETFSTKSSSSSSRSKKREALAVYTDTSSLQNGSNSTLCTVGSTPLLSSCDATLGVLRLSGEGCEGTALPQLETYLEDALSSPLDAYRHLPLDASQCITVIPSGSPQGAILKSKAIRLKTLKERALADTEAYQWLMEAYADTLPIIKSVTGWSSENSLKIMKKFDSASDALVYHAVKLPESISKNMLTHISKGAATLKKLQYTNPEVGWKAGGSMLIDIVTRFTKLAKKHEEQTKYGSSLRNNASESGSLVIYVTHHSALMDLQAALGIAYDQLHIPPFAGSIFAELCYVPATMVASDLEACGYGCNCFSQIPMRPVCSASGIGVREATFQSSLLDPCMVSPFTAITPAFAMGYLQAVPSFPSEGEVSSVKATQKGWQWPYPPLDRSFHCSHSPCSTSHPSLASFTHYREMKEPMDLSSSSASSTASLDGSSSDSTAGCSSLKNGVEEALHASHAAFITASQPMPHNPLASPHQYFVRWTIDGHLPLYIPVTPPAAITPMQRDTMTHVPLPATLSNNNPAPHVSHTYLNDTMRGDDSLTHGHPIPPLVTTNETMLPRAGNFTSLADLTEHVTYFTSRFGTPSEASNV